MSTEPKWNPGPTECENCGGNLRVINPIFTIREKPGKGWCSRACRSTVTGEDPEGPVAKKKAAAPAAPAPAPEPKKPVKLSGIPTGTIRQAKEASPRPSRSSNGAADLAGKLYKKSAPKFQANSARAQLWDLIKDGMTISALYDAANKAGIDGKAVLAKIRAVAPDALEVK